MQSTAPLTTAAPRRSRRRWLFIGGFALLVVATPIVYALISAWLEKRELEALYAELDAEDPHWRWPDLVAQQPPSPAQDNAALQALKVGDGLKATPFTLPAGFWKRFEERPRLNARLAPEDAKAARASLATMAPELLAEARKLKDMPAGRMPIEAAEPGQDVKHPDFLPMLKVMVLLACDAILRADDQEMEQAADSCLALLNATHAISDFPSLMAQLVRGAGQAYALKAIGHTLAQGQLSKQALQALQTALEREAAHDGLLQAMRGERAFGHQFYVKLSEGQTTFSKEYGGASHSSRVPVVVLDSFPSLLLRGYPEHLRLISEPIRASKLRDQERVEAFHALDARIERSSFMLQNGTLRFLTAQLAEVQDAQASLRCAVTAVAAERYRLEHGRWPTGANEVVRAGLLKEICKDPWDGQPLRWRRTNEGIVIYSIGNDKIDDGSKLDGAATRVATGDVGFVLWHASARQALRPATK